MRTRNRKHMNVVSKDIKIIPELLHNIFLITKAIKCMGCKLCRKNKRTKGWFMELCKEKVVIPFEKYL